jgi:type I site-specific restriction endonuclease
MPLTEADTCRKFVVPMLQAAGWDTEPHSIAEQRTIIDGRIVPVRQGFIRKPPRRVDYLLRFERNFPLAVVEAKAAWKTAGEPGSSHSHDAELMAAAKVGGPLWPEKKSTMKHRFRLGGPKWRRTSLRAT